MRSPPTSSVGRAYKSRAPILEIKEKTHLQWVRFFYLGAEAGFEPRDLRVMSPTSYQAALLRDIFGADSRTRTGTGISSQRILSPWRLPIPPHRLICLISISYKKSLVKCFFQKFYFGRLYNENIGTLYYIICV